MKNSVTALFELCLSKSGLSDDERRDIGTMERVNAAYAKIQGIASEYDKDNPIKETSNDRVFVLQLPEKSQMLGDLIHNAVVARYPHKVRFFALEVG